jgi:NADPH:quinone reductase-like Zn-dependent oxidoreductase
MLKPGGLLISRLGPPDPAFARAHGLNPRPRRLFADMSLGIGPKARATGVDDAFPIMHAVGSQLAKVAALVDAGAVRPAIDCSDAFAAVNEAFAPLYAGRAKGKAFVDFGRAA